MAGDLTIYSVYRLNGPDRYFLLRTKRPGFSNASQTEENAANDAEQDQRKQMLTHISKNFDSKELILVGEMQNDPIGEDLYTSEGNKELKIYYMKTQFGHPWIVLGTAGSEEEFLSELNNDEDLLRLTPIGQPIKITATYLTDDNFSLLQRPENTKLTANQINTSKMKDLNLIESADHNREATKKSLRRGLMLILICAIPAVVCRLFLWQYTQRALVTSWRYKHIHYITDVGWPATIYTWGTRLAIGFTLILLYSRLTQDLRKPSFGVADNGIFINQQMLRNAFVPWENIQKAELLGPAESPFMRLTFKDYKALLKGQPIILKSIAKANLKDGAVLSITKGETIGDIQKMYEMINDKVSHTI